MAVAVFQTLNTFQLVNGADISSCMPDLHAAAAPYIGWAWPRCVPHTWMLPHTEAML